MKGGVLSEKNLPTKEETKKERAWFQKENENFKRKERFKKKKS